MASLHEYFVKDGAQNLTTHQTWPLTNAKGDNLGELTVRLHCDFDANAKYISVFVPEMPDVECPEVFALNEVQNILKWPETRIGMQSCTGEEKHDAQDLVFTGQVYLYSERPVPQEIKARLIAESKAVGYRLTFRSVEYM